MNWGAWIATTLGISGAVAILSFVAFLAYGQGHLEGFKAGLKVKAEIDAKYDDHQ